MLNYGIQQNDSISLSEVEGELTIYDLSICEERGDLAYRQGNEPEAIEWYAKGLTLAKKSRSKDKINLFSSLIFVSL